MKRTPIIFFSIIFLALLIHSSALALRKLKDLSHGLPEGVKVYKYRSDDKRAVLYVAEMNRKYFPSIQFWTSIARGRVLGRQTVSEIVQQATRNGKNVLVAVNASFGVLHGDYEGVINNLHIQNRMLISPPNSYACFGVTKSGEFLMEDIKMNISVKIAGKEIPVQGLNQERDHKSTVLYTPRFGHKTQTDDGYEVVITDMIQPLSPGYKSWFAVKKVSRSGDTRIPKDGFVLSAREGSNAAKSLSNLKIGDWGELTVSLSPERWNYVVQGIGGNSRLVKHGKICARAHEGHNADRDDPRTALGYNDRKLFFMVVDGRQGDYSEGMTYRDVANAMIELGATAAINLDGGGSATFIKKDKLINRPSNGHERHVLNAVFIRK